MSADADELLSARAAYSRGDWRAAYDHFGRAHKTAELNTDDLSSYGMAAWRLGYGRESIRLSELPIAYAALIWVALALFALASPGGALVPDLIVVGLIVAGGLYFAKMLVFNREVLESEPGDSDAF